MVYNKDIEVRDNQTKTKETVNMKNVEIRVWNTEDKDLVEVFINNELWFDKWTNDLFSVMNFICENIQDAEMKVKYMN